jgi:hypothetical protein
VLSAQCCVAIAACAALKQLSQTRCLPLKSPAECMLCVRQYLKTPYRKVVCVRGACVRVSAAAAYQACA